jgi:hypothetical protein
MNDYIPYSRFDRDLNPARCFSGGTYRFGERTHFLAYMWTALTLLVSGITFIWSNRIDGLISDIPAPLFPDVFGKVTRWPGSGQILPFICAYDAKIADF